MQNLIYRAFHIIDACLYTLDLLPHFSFMLLWTSGRGSAHFETTCSYAGLNPFLARTRRAAWRGMTQQKKSRAGEVRKTSWIDRK